MKNLFNQWLKSEKKLADNTIYQYVRAVYKTSTHYSTQKNEPLDLYFNIDKEQLSSIIKIYDKNGEYEDFGNIGNKTNINGLKRYLEFLIFLDQTPDYSIQQDSEVPDLISFSYEADLQEALQKQVSVLFPNYEIYKEDKGKQYKIKGLISDKKIDLLLENKIDGSLLIIELKSEIAGYSVLGQVMMYKGLLKDEFPHKKIDICIIAGKISEELKIAVKEFGQTLMLKEYNLKVELMDI